MNRIQVTARTVETAKELIDHLAATSDFFEGGLALGRAAAQDLEAFSPAEITQQFIDAEQTPSDFMLGHLLGIYVEKYKAGTL